MIRELVQSNNNTVLKLNFLTAKSLLVNLSKTNRIALDNVKTVIVPFEDKFAIQCSFHKNTESFCNYAEILEKITDILDEFYDEGNIDV